MQENGPNRAQMALFSAFLVGHCDFPPKLYFFSETPRPIAEIQSYVSVFENSSEGPRFGAVSVVIWGKIGPKLGNGDKKGGKKFCSPKLLSPFLDLKFNGDYDFAIKHDLDS